jgi:excisionase family DNA binding protein
VQGCGPVDVQPSQPEQERPKAFAARLLQDRVALATSPGAAGAALRVVDGGRGHLLTVGAVAARLGVSTATVYALCKAGELMHVRVSNAIRIEPAEVEGFKARQGKRGTRLPVAQRGRG